MKKIKKIIKITLITLTCLFSICIISGFGYYHAVTYSVKLDSTKLETIKQNSNLKILDKNKNIIQTSTNSYAKISELSAHTKNAFIAVQRYSVSRLPAVSHAECIASCAMPMSMVSIGVKVSAMLPRVDPPSISLRLANFCTGTSARRQISERFFVLLWHTVTGPWA